MKLNYANDDATIISYTSGGSQARNFGFEMNAKAFRTLIDSQYKNKIGSVVREISSNALDSHIQAGKSDVPFEIHLPNAYEPYYSVKDFGVGLSKEDIEGVETITENSWFEQVIDPVTNEPTDQYVRKTDGMMIRTREGGIYTTMFKSTKDKSNEMIGGFGLGSKTPLAYTDSFSVTSIKDGVKYCYSVFINEEGIPAVLLLHSEETTEGNGVEVQIAVRKEHFATFRDEVANQLRFFPVKPIIRNGEVKFDNVFTPGNEELLVDTSNVRLKSEKDRYSYSRYDAEFTVVLGVVGYPLETSNLGSKLTRELQEFLSAIEGKVAFLFNIGDIEVIASREAISYTEQTIDAIVNKIKIAKTEIIAKIMANANMTGSPWEQACELNRFGDLTDLILKSGYSIPPAEDIGDKYGFDVYKAQVFNAQQRRDWMLGAYSTESASKTYRRTSKDVRNIVPDSNMVFFIRDTDKKPVARIKEYHANNPQAKVYVFDRMGVEFTDADVKEFERTLGGITIGKLSDLPEPKIVRRVSEDDGSYADRSGYKIPRAYRVYPSCFDKLEGKRINDSWGEKIFDDIEDIEPALYIASERGIVTMNSMHEYELGWHKLNEMQMLKRIYRAYEALGRQMPEVYMFNQKNIEKVAKMADWKPVHVFINEAMDEIKGLKNRITMYKAQDKVMHNIKRWMSESYLDKFIENIEKFDRESVGTYPIRLYRILKNRENKNEKLQKVSNVFGELFNSDTTALDSLSDCINEKLAEAKAKLKLVQYFPSSYYSGLDEETVNHAIKYINLMGRA